MPRSARTNSSAPLPTDPKTPTTSPARTSTLKSRTRVRAAGSLDVDAAHREPHLADLRLAAPVQLDVAADHGAHDPPRRRLRLAALQPVGDAAVAEHRDAVGDAGDLVEPMRDVDDRDALPPQLLDMREEHLRLGVGQRRGRLVERKEAHAAHHGPRDHDQLLLRREQRADALGRIDLGRRKSRQPALPPAAASRPGGSRRSASARD